MKNKSRKSKITKYIILAIILIIVLVFGIMIYKNLFASSNSTRYEGIEDHKLSNDEINSAREKLNELENIDSIDNRWNGGYLLF